MDLTLRPKESKPVQLNIELGTGGPTKPNALAQTSSSHALETAKNEYDINRHNINMRMLRNRDGLHAPLKLSMEMASARKVGRLPFLQSSNAMLDVLTGRDEMIEFGDYLSTEDTFEDMRQPHAVVEKSLGIF